MPVLGKRARRPIVGIHRAGADVNETLQPLACTCPLERVEGALDVHFDDPARLRALGGAGYRRHRRAVHDMCDRLEHGRDPCRPILDPRGEERDAVLDGTEEPLGDPVRRCDVEHDRERARVALEPLASDVAHHEPGPAGDEQGAHSMALTRSTENGNVRSGPSRPRLAWAPAHGSAAGRTGSGCGLAPRGRFSRLGTSPSIVSVEASLRVERLLPDAPRGRSLSALASGESGPRAACSVLDLNLVSWTSWRAASAVSAGDGAWLRDAIGLPLSAAARVLAAPPLPACGSDAPGARCCCCALHR